MIILNRQNIELSTATLGTRYNHRSFSNIDGHFQSYSLTLTWPKFSAYRDNGVLKFKIESETTGEALKRIEDDEDFMLEWLAPHEGPNYRIGTDVIIMTEPDDFKYVKESFKIWPLLTFYDLIHCFWLNMTSFDLRWACPKILGLNFSKKISPWSELVRLA